MKILFLGDVVGKAGSAVIRQKLSRLKRETGADFTVVNGENSEVGNGVTRESAEELFLAGADVITTGNHVYRRSSVYDYLDECNEILRPVNYMASNPGRGYGIYLCNNGKRVLVINALGRAFMDFIPDDPFSAVEGVLLKEKGNYDISLLDFHAESTSEKISVAHYFDGRITLFVGTHTHVQTSDERILRGGSAYITDAGMCGVIDSALGVDFEPVIRRMRYGTMERFTEAKGEAIIHGVICEIDDKTCRASSITRIKM